MSLYIFYISNFLLLLCLTASLIQSSKIINNEDKSNNVNMKHELQEYLNELSKKVSYNKVSTGNFNNNFTSRKIDIIYV